MAAFVASFARCSRVWLAAFCVLAAVSPLNAEAPFQKSQTAGYYRMMLGDWEMTALYDGSASIDANLLHGDPNEVADLLKKSFAKAGKVEGTVAGFLVNTGKNLVLVDTGTGGHWGGPSLGKLVANLTASGYRPDQVDTVLLTHLHADHVGGITSLDGARVFPKAEIRMAKVESDFWLSQENSDKAPIWEREFFQIARDAAHPYIAAGKWHPFESTDEILPGIRPYPLPGHTPGHTGYVFASKGEKMLVWGDIVHAVNLQLQDPAIGVVFDVNSTQAVQSRKTLFEELSSNGTLVAGAHMPFPCLGRLRKIGSGYVWLPVTFTDAL
jgi:glyoxylase-like metal-dependent hydrolase (beta-lactamase superfamily II)